MSAPVTGDLIFVVATSSSVSGSVSLLERKAENLRARLIEHLGNDVALVFPDEQAFAIEGRPGKFKLPRAFRGNGPGSRLRIRLVDFINGQRVPFRVVVPDVTDVQVSRVVDGDVFPIVQRHADNGEGRARVALAVDGVEDLFLWPAAVVVRPVTHVYRRLATMPELSLIRGSRM